MSPTIIFSAIALGVAGFLATSGDNLVILLGLYGDRTYRSRDVFVGYVGAIGLVVVAARLFAAVAHQAPPGIVGYLGVIPLGLGVKQLIELARTSGPTAERVYRPAPARAGALADTPTDVLGMVPARW